MSFIQFESSRVKEAERDAIRRGREKILAEAEERYHKKEAQAEKARERGDDKWMLPSVDAKFSDKSKKKKKKEKKSKKSKKKKRRKSSSSSSDSSGEEEWVEKSVETPKNSSEPVKPLERDEWMNLSGSFLCAPREKKGKKEEEEKKTCILVEPGQSSRELNPYWRDGGSGLPEEEEKQKKAPEVMNPQWLKKSLQRAKEQAEEEGRSLEEIAEERWGSLDTIKAMIEKAERSCRRGGYEGDRRGSYEGDRRGRYRSGNHEHRRRDFDFDKPLDHKINHKLAFKKPGEDGDARSSRSSYNSRSTSSAKSWRKPEVNDRMRAAELETSSRSRSRAEEKRQKSTEINDNDRIRVEESLSPSRSRGGEKRPKSSESSSSEDERAEERSTSKVQEETILSEDELNKLGAKIVKAEIMGDTELAQELKQKLEKAREARKSNPKPVESSSTEETVILTKMNSKGMARPLEPRSRYEEPQGGRRRGKKVETHEKGERVRYFADDDKYSLKEMFQREKGESSHKDDSMFVKMASKSMDMDELFEQRITRGETDAKEDLRDKMRAIKEHKTMEKSLDNCRLCLDSKEMLKHLIVAMGSKMYLSLPPHVSLTSGHCVIAPVHHISSQTQLDEDIYEELKTFKKAITKMCSENKECPVFFEVSMGLRRFPHMQLECVPLPEEVGSTAPMYFKKALLECEMEWSTNKKVVELNKKDIRQAIPRGLPYFMVDFGDHGGFAHVIEDETLFPRNFAQEIIGGMLDLDSGMWRKPRKENFERQRKKVVDFAEKWKKYDFTT